MKQEFSRSGSSKAVVLVKALPQISEVYGETVCVAAVDEYGQWKRLYPVTFGDLAPEQRFSRWHVISFDWQLRDAAKDRRAESLRVDQKSIRIERELTKPKREAYLNRAIVTGTRREYEEGRSLALVKADELEFYWRPRSAGDLDKIRGEYARLRATPADLFGVKRTVEREPAPTSSVIVIATTTEHTTRAATTGRRRRHFCGVEPSSARGAPWSGWGRLLAKGTRERAWSSPWAPTRSGTGSG